MADEITVTVQIKAVKGGSTASWQESNLSRTWTGNNHIRHRQTVGTSEEAILLGDAGAGGYVMCKNHDATNFVQIRPVTGESALIKLLAGDVALFRLDGSSVPCAIADTAACEVEFLVLEL